MHTMNNILVLSSLIEMFIIMFIFCYNIEMHPPTLGERVCVHVCVWVCACVLTLCVYVCSWFRGGRLFPIHLSVCRSARMIFFIYFFKIKCCWYLKSDKSWFWTPIRNLLNCYSLFVRKSSLNSLLIVCSC